MEVETAVEHNVSDNKHNKQLKAKDNAKQAKQNKKKKKRKVLVQLHPRPPEGAAGVLLYDGVDEEEPEPDVVREVNRYGLSLAHQPRCRTNNG